MILDFYNAVIENRDINETNKKLIDIDSNICSYGTEDAIKILTEMETYKENNIKIIAYIVLLISQVRKDIDSNIINPKYWMKSKITDYESEENTIINEDIKNIVISLKLDKKFIVK